MAFSSQNFTDPPPPSDIHENTADADTKLYTKLKTIVNKGKYLKFQAQCYDPGLAPDKDPDYEHRGERESNRAVIECYRKLKEPKIQMEKEAKALAENEKALKALVKKVNADKQKLIGDYKNARGIVLHEQSMVDKTLQDATKESPHAHDKHISRHAQHSRLLNKMGAPLDSKLNELEPTSEDEACCPYSHTSANEYKSLLFRRQKSPPRIPESENTHKMVILVLLMVP